MFSVGNENLRDVIFANQKKFGVIPDAQPPWLKEIPKWHLGSLVEKERLRSGRPTL